MTLGWETLILAALLGWIAVIAINKSRGGVRLPDPSDPKPELEHRGPENDLWDRLVENGGCVACDIKPKGFAEGPSGGMNTNVFCIRCGQGYNIAPMLSWAQEIGKNDSYIEKEVKRG